jgi:GT2 family glycosyltransferase
MTGARDMAVVVVNWNGREDLLRCLASLRAQTEQGFEVVVVDNGSSDGSGAAVRNVFPEARLIEAGDNLGFAEGCNRGLDVTSAHWIATLNNDAEAAPDWIASLATVVRGGGPDLGMVQSRIVFRQRPDRTNSTGVLVYEDGMFVDRDFDVLLRPGDAVEEIFCPSAGAALYRRAMLEQARLASGVFDRTFFMFFEDVDLGWRCRLAGWRALYAPHAVVHHAFHASAGRRGAGFVRLHCERNRVRTLLKNASARLVARSLPRLCRGAWFSLGARGRHALGDYAAAVRDGLAQRDAVSRLCKISRREVERRWVRRRSPG